MRIVYILFSLNIVVTAMNSCCQLSSRYHRIVSYSRNSMMMKLSTKVADASLFHNVVQKNVWNSPVGTLKGVGPVMIDTLDQLGISTIADVLFHFPTSIIDRRNRIRLSQALIGDLITVELKVTAIEQGFGGRPHLIECTDIDGSPLEVRYFCSPAMTLMKWGEIKREYKINTNIILNGKLTHNKYTSNHEVINPDILLSLDLPAEYINEKFGVEPVYGLTKGLTNAKFRSIVKLSLEKISKNNENNNMKNDDILIDSLCNDWMLSEYRNDKKWPTFLDALNQIHRPDCVDDVHENCIARTRLAFDDFVSQFLHQLEKENDITIANNKNFLILKKFKIDQTLNDNEIVNLNDNSTENLTENMSKNLNIIENEMNLIERTKSFSVVGDGFYTKKLEEILPFSLTNCQKKALIDINSEIALESKMSRLLQGDVGSGKTLVAVLSILTVIENNQQGAILAPTELLAKQHYNVIHKYFNRISDVFSEVSESQNKTESANHNEEGDYSHNYIENNNKGNSNEKNFGKNAPRRRLRVELITKNVRGKVRENMLLDMKNGLIDVLIGTHAILNDDVLNSIPSLGLAIIDEEQRFGVNQRELLSSRTNTIYMTATPIPRSLFILLENENTISTLIEKPPMKRKVKTVILPYRSVDSIISRLQIHVPLGTKIFWVSPSLMANELEPTGNSVMERYEQLSALFPGKVGLMHGKMSPEDKDAVMNNFSKIGSDINILVATTVIEVGVDVPDSSICIIDRAANFGLSQLHQIRGRIGRGEKPPLETLEECFCVLLYDDRPALELNSERNSMMKFSSSSSSDGGYDNENQIYIQGSASSLSSSSSSSSIPSALPSLSLSPPSQEEKEKGQGQGQGGGRYIPTDPPIKLQILKDTSDGFVIAEKDLLLRGPGDFFGFQQSGLKYAGLRAGSLIPHVGLLKDAHKMASIIYSNDYILPFKDEKIQTLLSLFPSPSSAPSLHPSSSSSSSLSSSSLSSSSSSSLSSSSSSTSKSDTKKVKLDKEIDSNDIETISEIKNSKSVKLKSVNSDEMYVDFLQLDTDNGDDVSLAPLIIIFDLETSGLNHRWGDKIIQLGAKVLNDNNKENIFDCYIKTNGLIIPSIITSITKITQYDHDTKGRPFAIVWNEFVIWLDKMSKTDSGKNRPIALIAHNGANFDVPFLNYEVNFNKLSKIEGDWMVDANVVCFVDSVRLLRDENIWTDRREILGINKRNDRPKSKGLESIYNFIFDRKIENAHSAMGDVIALEAILESDGLKGIWRKYANKIQFNI